MEIQSFLLTHLCVNVSEYRTRVCVFAGVHVYACAEPFSIPEEGSLLEPGIVSSSLD